MRRILAALFTCVSAIVVACVGFAWSLSAPGDLTDDGTTAIFLSGDARLLGDTTVRQWVEAIPEKFGVDVERVVSTSAGVTDVYASDMTLGGRVVLSEGAFPAAGREGDEYVASADTGSELQTGRFELFAPQVQVLVHPLDALDHRDTYLGELHLRTTDAAQVEQILAYLSAHVGPAARVDGSSSGASGGGVTVRLTGVDYLLAWLVTNPIVAGALALLAFLVVFACVRYAIRASRDVAILRLCGAGLPRILFWHAARLLPCALASWAVCAAGVTVVVGIVLRSPFALPTLLLVDAACAAGLLALALLVLALATALQNARFGVARIIAGKRPFATLTAMQLVLKYAVLAVVLVGLTQAGGALASLRQADAANDAWKQVQGVYAVRMNDVGQMAWMQGGDVASERALTLKVDATYQAMRDECGLVLAYVTNFAPYYDGRELWEVNTGPDSPNQDPWWSPYGRTITVNENYLDAWPVTDVEGRDVRELLTHDPTRCTRTVLVPASLRPHEDEIRRLFLEDFQFQKVRVHDEIAGVPAGEEPLGLTEDDLSVRIIYVPDGLGWFSYDANVAPQTSNRIIDPLVVVDDHEADPDFYYAWMTSSCSYPADPYDPTRPLRQVAARFDAADALDSVYSVYDQRAAQLAQVRQQLAVGLACEALLAAGAILCIYLFVACWFVQHRRRTMVRRLHGWPLVRIAGPLLVASLVLTAALALAWPGEVPLAARLALPAADLLVTLACCWQVQRAQVACALKGEG